MTAREIAKRLALSAARLGGATALARRRHRCCLRILAYHGVDAGTDAWLNFDGFHVSPDVFRSQMERLARSCRVIALADAVSCLAGGDPLPEHAAVITFDDGYLNNLETAAPILREFGFPATFFVTTGFMDSTHRPWWFELRGILGKTSQLSVRAPDGSTLTLQTAPDRIQAIVSIENQFKNISARSRADRLVELAQTCGAPASQPTVPMMTPAGVKKLTDLGFEVGPHTVSHISLGVESEAVVLAEIRESAERIKAVTGLPPRCYSYPYGRTEDISAETVRVLKQEGFTGALTTVEGMNTPGADVMKLARLNVTGRHDGNAFEALVTGLTTELGARVGR